jgi:hypothetical protein
MPKNAQLEMIEITIGLDPYAYRAILLGGKIWHTRKK